MSDVVESRDVTIVASNLNQPEPLAQSGVLAGMNVPDGSAEAALVQQLVSVILGYAASMAGVGVIPGVPLTTTQLAAIASGLAQRMDRDRSLGMSAPQ